MESLERLALFPFPPISPVSHCFSITSLCSPTTRLPCIPSFPSLLLILGRSCLPLQIISLWRLKQIHSWDQRKGMKTLESVSGAGRGSRNLWVSENSVTLQTEQDSTHWNKSVLNCYTCWGNLSQGDKVTLPRSQEIAAKAQMLAAPKLRWTAGYGDWQSHYQHHCMYPHWSASTTAGEECLHPFLPNIT